MNTLTKYLQLHRLWLDGHPDGVRLDLRGVDLRGVDLRGADLRGTILHNTDLFGADLTGANLFRANLTGATLPGANLTGAILHNTDLYGANLTGAVGVVDAGTDPRGYRFIGVIHEDGPRISAGCRWFTIPEARDHWSRADNRDALARVALIEAVL